MGSVVNMGSNIVHQLTVRISNFSTIVLQYISWEGRELSGAGAQPLPGDPRCRM